jgi:adenine phosphoribosyltransferase
VEEMTESIKSKIRTVPHWPKKNIMFRDITTLLKNPIGFKETIDHLYQRYQDRDIDLVVGIESRGFILGAPLAYLLGTGFVPIRKPGKLPAACYSEEYNLEYGKDTVEIHKDAIKPNMKILLVDDLLATGGTMEAAIKLIHKLKGDIVECVFVVELPDLNGRERLKDIPIYSIVKFEGE